MSSKDDKAALPVSTMEVNEVQEDLVKLNLKVKSLSERFKDCVSEREMESVNEDIRRLLATFRQRLERLERLAHFQRTAEAREMLLRDLSGHREQLAASQANFRRANLDCIVRLQKTDRAELFDGGEERIGGSLRSRRTAAVDKASLIKDSGRVTDSLSAISRQLAATVERSAATVDELVESSGAVREVQDEFKGMGAVIGQSRKLINKYARRETTDMVLILFAFCFFFAVVFYILRKRVLGPLDPFSFVWNTVITLLNTLINAVLAVLNSRGDSSVIDEEAAIK